MTKFDSLSAVQLHDEADAGAPAYALSMTARPVPQGGSDWDQLNDDITTLLPPSAPAAPHPAAPAMRPPTPAAQRLRAPGGSDSGSTQSPGLAPHAPGGTQRTIVAAKPHAVRAPVTVASIIVPAVVFVAGGATAGWYYGHAQNYVMAGIVTALTIIGSTFAHVFVRR